MWKMLSIDEINSLYEKNLYNKEILTSLLVVQIKLLLLSII
jgi:hypothetical protein